MLQVPNKGLHQITRKDSRKKPSLYLNFLSKIRIGGFQWSPNNLWKSAQDLHLVFNIYPLLIIRDEVYKGK